MTRTALEIKHGKGTPNKLAATTYRRPILDDVELLALLERLRKLEAKEPKKS